MTTDLLQWGLELWRRRGRDESQARQYVAEQSSAVFREIMADYDTFVEHLAAIPASAVLIGTARDSAGKENSLGRPPPRRFPKLPLPGAPRPPETRLLNF